MLGNPCSHKCTNSKKRSCRILMEPKILAVAVAAAVAIVKLRAMVAFVVAGLIVGEAFGILAAGKVGGCGCGRSWWM
jgi:hypothetical protein